MSEKKSENLYHYTSLQGFIGIVESKKIYATHSLYLNDDKEITHGFDLTETQIREKIKLYKNNALHDQKKVIYIEKLLSFLDRARTVLIRIENFVCSFTEEGDLLSQWRGYSANGGVSFSFTKEYLEKLSDKYDLKLEKCVYNKSLKTREINEKIETYLNECKKTNPTNSNDFNEIIFDALRNFLAISIKYKDESFKEEKEWRIICKSKIAKELGIFFRTGKSSIIPYTKIPLEGDDPIEFSSINLGPTVKSDLSVASIEFLLKTNHIKFSNLNTSRIPYRDW